VSPVKYELGFYIPEGDIVHSHRRVNLKSYLGIRGFDVRTLQASAVGSLSPVPTLRQNIG
jgi:hypothetical protein